MVGTEAEETATRDNGETIGQRKKATIRYNRGGKENEDGGGTMGGTKVGRDLRFLRENARGVQ